MLSHRFREAVGGEVSLDEFDQLMPSSATHRSHDARGDSAAALGNRIAATIIEAGLKDGSREQHGYAYPKQGYQPVNEPMVVAESGR